MYYQQHKIQCLRFEVNTPVSNIDGEDGNDVADFCQNELVSVVERTLDSFDFSEEAVFIEKLEVDIETTRNAFWQERIKEQLVIQLTKKLSGLHSRDSGNISIPANRHFKALWYFLNKADFPWWYTQTEIEQLENNCTKHLTIAEVSKLLLFVKNNKYATQRLINSFLEEFLAALFDQTDIDFLPREVKSSLHRFLESKQIGIPDQNSFALWFWECLIKAGHENQPVLKIGRRSFAEILLMESKSIPIVSKDSRSKEFFQKDLPSMLSDFITQEWPEISPALGLEPELKKGELPEQEPGDEIQIDQSPASSALRNIQTASSDKSADLPQEGEASRSPSGHKKIKHDGESAQEPANFQGKSDLENTGAEPGQNQAIPDTDFDNHTYISYAGIVLLHPFLNTFFSNFELLEKKKWISEKEQNHAVHLLAFLATGEMYCPEHEMQLFKFMAGLPFESYVSHELCLSDAEVDEADMLLNSVISHWSVLKDTSKKALRDTFIKRSGKLYRKENTWNLQVEQKSIDVLMNRLPWNISVIKLPWLAHILQIVWC